MGDLETIKVVLRSLLISSNRSVTVFELQRDFRQNEGYECPFAALGYRNFISFLQSIPDTVTVFSNNVVKAVTTEETAHIQRLVALQKKSKPKRRPVVRSSSASSYYGSSYSSSYRRYSSSQAYQPRRLHSSDRSYQPPQTNPTRSSSHSGYNFPSSSYTIDRHFEKVREVKELARQTAATSEQPTLREQPTLSEQPTSRASTSFEAGLSGETFLSNWKKQSEENVESLRVNCLPEGMTSDESDDSFYEKFKDEGDEFPNQGGTIKSAKAPELDVFVQSSVKINEQLKTNLKNLIKSYPEGLMACVLPAKYEEKFGVSLQWNELGYDSIVQMIHDLKDIIVCKRLQGGDWKLYDACLPLPAENSDEVVVLPVPGAVKSKIYNIVKKYATGIRLEQLVQLYQEYYGKCLSSEAPGFKSAEAFFLSIQDTVTHLRKIQNEFYIYPGQPPPQPLTQPLLKVDSDSKVKLGLYPDEVMKPKESYPPPELPSNLEPGAFIELRVAEVYNPHKFWIMLREHSSKLEDLMNELQDFYLDHGEKYVMPDSTIAVGQCCTSKYDNEWHRATILSIGETIEVQYVDYGTVAKVLRSDLRFIHQDFCTLPSQAIRASLCGIQPPNGRLRFTREANQAFYKLVVEKHLIGVVQNVDREEPFLELFLVDTSGDTDVHLNDVLVNKNHAVFKLELLETANLLENTVSQEQHKDLQSGQTLPSTTAANVLPKTECPSSISPTGATSSPNIPTSCSPVQPVTNPIGSGHTLAAPPGFPVHSGQIPGVPSAINMGIGPYGVNMGFNMLNPPPAAYPTPYLPQVNALWMQQQQQQALWLACLYQQQSILAAQSKMAAAAAATGTFANSPWLGAPLVSQQYCTTNSQSPSAQNNSSSQLQSLAEKNVDSEHNTLSETGLTPVKKCAKGILSNTVIPAKAELRQLTSMSSDPSSSSDDVTIKKVVRKKRRERRSSTPSFSARPSKPNKTRATLQDEEDQTLPCTNVQMPVSRVSVLSELSSSSNSLSDIVVECLEDLMGDTDSESSCRNVAPDLVQSVSNLSISHRMTNFWKIIDISKKSLHLFNVDQRAHISTGELARKFTGFSTCDSLVRVLKNKDIIIPYKKASRQDKLPLFSALDGCSDEMLDCFDLSRNKTGSTVGVFHLTPLANVPSMLIPLGVDIATVKEFKALRNSFNPHENYWTQ